MAWPMPALVPARLNSNPMIWHGSSFQILGSYCVWFPVVIDTQTWPTHSKTGVISWCNLKMREGESEIKEINERGEKSIWCSWKQGGGKSCRNSSKSARQFIQDEENTGSGLETAATEFWLGDSEPSQNRHRLLLLAPPPGLTRWSDRLDGGHLERGSVASQTLNSTDARSSSP